MAQVLSFVIDQINSAAHAHALEVFGALNAQGETVVLLGPSEPGFWPHVNAAPELQDGAPDPLDRWSKRVITALAIHFDAVPVFPSDGPPYAPFISWALAGHETWLSPVGLLVHARAGLFTSYRGALRLKGEHAPVMSRPPKPCEDCAAPCKTACPVGALHADRYDVVACKAHVTGPDTAACRAKGCAARRACPVSQTYPRMAEQSAFHMRAFLGE